MPSAGVFDRSHENHRFVPVNALFAAFLFVHRCELEQTVRLRDSEPVRAFACLGGRRDA